MTSQPHSEGDSRHRLGRDNRQANKNPVEAGWCEYFRFLLRGDPNAIPPPVADSS